MCNLGSRAASRKETGASRSAHKPLLGLESDRVYAAATEAGKRLILGGPGALLLSSLPYSSVESGEWAAGKKKGSLPGLRGDWRAGWPVRSGLFPLIKGESSKLKTA